MINVIQSIILCVGVASKIANRQEVDTIRQEKQIKLDQMSYDERSLVIESRWLRG